MFVFSLFIAFLLSKDADTAYALPLQQVKAWLELLQNTRRAAFPLVEKAWRLQASCVNDAELHWACARGPTAASLCVLKDLVWRCPSLFWWCDRDAVQWCFDFEDLLSVRRPVEHLAFRREGQL